MQSHSDVLEIRISNRNSYRELITLSGLKIWIHRRITLIDSPLLGPGIQSTWLVPGDEKNMSCDDTR